jgi:metal-dependent amidase/aminoacylase/carboxypeptidase family protein
MVALGKRVAEAALGPQCWHELPQPCMGGEDFAYYLRDYPGAMFFLGQGESCPPLHSPRFDFNDRALKNGVTFLACAALEALAAARV